MSLPQRQVTVEAYLELERASETRHEFVDGDIVAMAGADRQHDMLAVGVCAELRLRFRGRPCVVHSSDMRVRVSPTRYTYPDASALCGQAQYEDSHVDTLLNPTLIVEVLSKSTEGYDRGRKFLYYRRLPSLTDYVLVSQDRALLEHYVRQSDGRWTLNELNGLEAVLELRSLGVSIPLSDIYDKVPVGEAP